MKFVYLLPGWEGSAHDGRVLKDAVRHSFDIPEGYALNSYTLTPYRGTRYHLKEFGRGSQKPQNKEELFNLRHSSLRNVIERGYVIKAKLPILKAMPSYSLREQIGLIQASFVLHNFIRFHNDSFADTRVLGADGDADNEDSAGDEIPVDLDETPMAHLRDRIASEMWRDYLMRLAERDGEVVVYM
uniref:DDE Tnp4 domain-containing protein n=1 Tax=Phytophthora fragariae TaxID=53985 RepID=A0A6A3DFL0_9STRA|nr:hypothetical protein PF009_g30595 [Phytophthora fragariae]